MLVRPAREGDLQAIYDLNRIAWEGVCVAQAVERRCPDAHSKRSYSTAPWHWAGGTMSSARQRVGTKSISRAGPRRCMSRR